uniref:Major facilitator superfamily (MFS) profile domain-containing protein n=1 Tax=Panagrolaimus sp. PS1159 TaxID=55785 RepID=A0AC35GJI2_9BILA
MIALNFTFICMLKQPKNTSSTMILTNTAEEDINTSPKLEYYYNQNQKSSLMWASAIGSMIATFPFNYLYTKFGAKYVFFAAGIISTIATAFIPIAAEAGIIWFLILRFFQGISYGADFAAIGILCSRWASLKQNGVFISILTTFTHIASTITNPVSGILCESRFGWPSVYYSHAAVSLIMFILWLIFYCDDPAKHKSVSAIELEKIHRNKTETHKNMESYVPYKEICKNPVILAVWFNAFVDIVSAMFLTTYIPTYINSVLHYGIGNTGWLAALPTLAHLPVKFLSGHLSDKIN